MAAKKTRRKKTARRARKTPVARSTKLQRELHKAEMSLVRARNKVAVADLRAKLTRTERDLQKKMSEEVKRVSQAAKGTPRRKKTSKKRAKKSVDVRALLASARRK